LTIKIDPDRFLFLLFYFNIFSQYEEHSSFSTGTNWIDMLTHIFVTLFHIQDLK